MDGRDGHLDYRGHGNDEESVREIKNPLPAEATIPPGAKSQLSPEDCVRTRVMSGRLHLQRDGLTLTWTGAGRQRNNENRGARDSSSRPVVEHAPGLDISWPCFTQTSDLSKAELDLSSSQSA